MKALFLNPPFGHERPEGLDAPMGIMYLGAVLKQHGHSCYLVDNVWAEQNDWSKWDNALSDNPDIVLINTHIRYSDETSEAMRLLRKRRASLIAIAFGPQASTEASRLLSEMGFDACVIGEPEGIIPGILKELQQNPLTKLKTFPGLATAENHNPEPAPRIDVNSLPFPDWKLGDYGRYIDATNNAVVMASRGLDSPDDFNQPPLIFAVEPAYRCSVDRVVSELAALRKSFPGHYMILFHDEVFTGDREWAVSLCGAIERAGLGAPYWCFTRPEMIDETLCIIMKKAGFAGISMGMESSSDRVLKMLGRNVSREQIENGFRIADRAGLLTVGSVMIGTPGCGPDMYDETWEEIKETIGMVTTLRPDVLTVTLTTPLPGTALYKRCRDRILAKSQEEFNIYNTWRGKYPVRLNNLTPDDLAEGVTHARSAWKRQVMKTALKTVKLGLTNKAFRYTLIAQVAKVVRRKIMRY